MGKYLESLLRRTFEHQFYETFMAVYDVQVQIKREHGVNEEYKPNKYALYGTEILKLSEISEKMLKISEVYTNYLIKIHIY